MRRGDPMQRWLVGVAGTALVVAVLAGLAGAMRTGDQPDPTGTWKWTAGAPDRESTVRLRLEGNRLTGTVTDPDGSEATVEEATYQGGRVSFTVTRDHGTRKSATHYSGTLTGDAIRGRSAPAGRDGQWTSRDWEARRTAG
jgi:hypothetical protein